MASVKPIGNFDLYKVFYHVATEGNLTKAAAILNVSQPAVSQSMKQLEDYLGVKLTERSGHGIRLTDEGRTLYPYVREGFLQFTQGEELVIRNHENECHMLSVSSVDWLASYPALSYFESFKAQYPETDFSLLTGTEEETIRNVSFGNSSVGIVLSHPNEPAKDASNKRNDFPSYKGLTVREITTVEFIFITGTQYRHFSGQALPLRILEHLPVIRMPQSSVEYAWEELFFASHSITAKNEMTLSSPEMIIQFCSRNLGIGFVPKVMAEAAIASGEIFPLTFQETPISPKLCIITKEKATLSQRAAQFIELIENNK